MIPYEQTRLRLKAYIAPCAPCTGEQEDALTAAATAQTDYEQTDAAGQLAQMPSGLTAFSVNGFSATLGGERSASEARLFPAGLCPEARALLLLSGLLYRGAPVC